MASENVYQCDREGCGGDTFYILENGNLMCADCNVEMINIAWRWTEEHEEYVELELEDGSKFNLTKGGKI